MRKPSYAIKLRKIGVNKNKNEDQMHTLLAYRIRVMLSHVRLKFAAWMKIVSKYGRTAATEEPHVAGHPHQLQKLYAVMEECAAPTTPPTGDEKKLRNPFPAFRTPTPKRAATPASARSSPLSASGAAATPSHVSIVDSGPRHAMASPVSPPPIDQPEAFHISDEGDRAVIDVVLEGGLMTRLMEDGERIPCVSQARGDNGFVIAAWESGDELETEILNNRLGDDGIISDVKPLPLQLNKSDKNKKRPLEDDDTVRKRPSGQMRKPAAAAMMKPSAAPMPRPAAADVVPVPAPAADVVPVPAPAADEVPVPAPAADVIPLDELG
eukprot:3949835-Pyramimonas_sp.AAC.1